MGQEVVVSQDQVLNIHPFWTQCSSRLDTPPSPPTRGANMGRVVLISGTYSEYFHI